MASVLQLWDTMKEAILSYTGLSPATFFTILAVAVALYYAMSGFFQPPPPVPGRTREMEPIPPPVQLGEITEEELKAYDGSDPKKPLLMAIKGQIYDVSQSRVFYGPGGPYALFTGKDASRALAKMSFEEKDLTGDISGLGPFELDALQDWEYKFTSKYVKVGTVKKTIPVATDVFAQTTEGGPSYGSTDHPETPKEVDISAGHVAESKEADGVELKDVDAGEGTRE